MFFISAAQFFRVHPSHSRHTVTCLAQSSASSNRKTNHGDPNPQKHSKTSHHDIWNTAIDDQTPPETLIYLSRRTPPIRSTKVDSQARMDAKPSKHPKPDKNLSATTNKTPKRKRGRPKGSKSVNKSSMPKPKISPFMSAVRDDIRRRSIAAKRDIMSDLLNSQSDEPVNWEDVQLSAPNGLPDGNNNTDLLQELLPIIAQQENEERRVVTEEERRMKQLVSTCYTQFNSIHRSSDRLDNLKPYKLQQESEEECQTCGGTGMTVCEYCNGEGFVDLGENGEKFNPKFGDNFFSMPKRVTGNIYHCPLCGGLQQERCISCFGKGVTSDGSDVSKGAPNQAREERAWKVFDMNELIERERDRIEIGLDGTIVMRAKLRGRRKKSTVNADKPKPQKRRSQATKSAAKGDTRLDNRDNDGAEPATVANFDADLTSDLQGLAGDTSGSLTIDDDHSVIPPAPAVVMPPGRPVKRTTDFVNTTDYQFGRRLERQSPNNGHDFQDRSKDSLNSSLPRSNQDGAGK